jgi:hypothetical protein
MITGKQFDVAQSEKVLEDVFYRTTIGPSTKLRIGPKLSQMLLDRSGEQITNVEDFADSLQVSPLHDEFGTVSDLFPVCVHDTFFC